MNKYPDYKLSIDGHTDNTGAAEVNRKLSENRAKACRDYLMTKGFRKAGCPTRDLARQDRLPITALIQEERLTDGLNSTSLQVSSTSEFPAHQAIAEYLLAFSLCAGRVVAKACPGPSSVGLAQK